MARQNINVGTTANDGTGDALRSAGQKINANFVELYNQKAATADLASTDSGKGGALVGFIQSGTGAVARTVRDKARETVSVLDFGAVGDGTTDDTAAINNAIATGKNVRFPEGYTFITQGLHEIDTSGQRIVIDGTVKYDGVRRFIATGVYGFQGLFRVLDQTEGVTFEGSGIMDGNWRRAGATAGQPLEFRDAGAGIYAYRAIGLRVRGITFQHFSEDGVKALNCPNLVIEPTSTFYDICNVGVELHSYLNDPRTGVPWVGAVQPPSGSIDGFYDWIDDGERFLNFGNGCGVAFNAASGALPVQNLTISGEFRDCLAAIWSENNYSGSEAQNISIVGVKITGNYRGAGTAETLQGIGLIGVKNSTVVAPVIRNVGNVPPAGGSNSAGLHIVECNGISIINPTITDDTGAADRTQYGIRVNAGTNIDIRGGSIDGMATSPIVQVSAPTNVRIESVRGATTDEAWGNLTMYGPFEWTDLPASANTYGLIDGQAGMDDIWIPAPGRIVGLVARLSAGASSGTIDIRPYANTVEQTAAGITNAMLAGGSRGTSRCAPSATAQIAAGQRIEVVITTGGLSPAGSIDARVWVLVDHGMKA